MFQTDKLSRILDSGTPEVDSYDIYGKQFIVSHIPFNKTKEEEEITGMVSTAYLNDNLITEEIARKWLYLNQQVQYYKDELDRRPCEGRRFDQMVSFNPVFQEIKREARLIARSTSTVLLTGESGVGKDMFARGLHEASPRASGIKANCVSIPESLNLNFSICTRSFTSAKERQIRIL